LSEKKVSPRKCCPECSTKLEPRVIVDSWDRIYDRYRICPQCGWDSRTPRIEMCDDH